MTGVRGWLALERRLAALAAIGLLVSLFFPWYRETVVAPGLTGPRSVTESLTGWAAFSFVEVAVLLVAAGVLTLLCARAGGRALHLPGGDGGVITAAGLGTIVLVIWRMFDKAGTTRQGLIQTSWGIEWGSFVALGLAGLLTYAGIRIRRARAPVPPRPDELAGRPGHGAAAPASRGVSRTPDMGADGIWLQGSGRRIRPSSVAAGLDPGQPGRPR